MSALEPRIRTAETGRSDPGRVEFARGSLVLFACFIGIGVSSVSLMGYSASAFILPLSEEFGWSRAQIGASAAISNLVLFLAAPFAGRLIDRHGLRGIATGSMLLYAAGVAGLSLMSGALWQFYALSAFITFVAIASTPLAFTRAVTAFFDHRRGLALGLALSSTGVAGILAPSLLAPFVADEGWRAGYRALTVVVLLAIPIVFLLVRDAPPPPKVGALAAQRAGLTLRQALRDPTFWTLAAVFVLAAAAVNGLTVSFIPMLIEAGKTPAAAGALTALIGASVVVGRLTTGFLIDRLFAPRVAAAVFALAALALLIFWSAGPAVAALAAVGLGLALGAEVDLIGYLTSRYFGLSNYAAVFGAQYSLFLLGAGLSPVAAGAVFDLTGGYGPAVIAGAALLTLAALTCLRLRPFPEEFCS